MKGERKSERLEAVLRIFIVIISGVIILVWRVLIIVLAILHLFVVLFVGKRDIGLANFSEYWNSEIYRFTRYMTFASNERPFPFNELKKFKHFEE